MHTYIPTYYIQCMMHYIYNVNTPRPGVPPEGLSCDQLFRLLISFSRFFHGFSTVLFFPRFSFKAYVGFHVRFRVEDLGFGFRVLCFGNKSRQPSCKLADIPKCIEDWPCAVKTHFPGQHIRPGRVYIYIYTCHDIYTWYRMTQKSYMHTYILYIHSYVDMMCIYIYCRKHYIHTGCDVYT